MRIGVVGGAGKIGQLHIQSINENPQTTLAAGLDISQEAAENAAAGAPAQSGGLTSEPIDYKIFSL